MKLYGFPYSHNTRKVLIVAHALGIELEFETVNLLAKESYTPTFKKLNPNGLTPVLEDGDFLLWESGAIMQYLCAQKPGNALYPSAPKVRAKIDQWLYWNARHWDPILDRIIIERMVIPLEGGATNEETVATYVDAAGKLTPVLNDHLATRDYVAGDLSLADIALASLVMYHPMANLPLDGCNNIFAWYDRVKSHPSWLATEPDWDAIG